MRGKRVTENTVKRERVIIETGVVHEVPPDLGQALVSDPEALERWNDLTPLARNEWICWTISVKKAETPADHVRRVVAELNEGKRRPCCRPGCRHR
jgi:uncharacterized protein YdeI (YjbR/CyaY-like superfamily)